jgi:hypothetical protein
MPVVSFNDVMCDTKLLTTTICETMRKYHTFFARSA